MLPNYLASYSNSVIVFYVLIVYVIFSAFRSAFIPQTWETYVINAPFTESILNICRCIYIYRVQKKFKEEEELYFILLEIMRSPETIKQLCGSSLKKDLVRSCKEEELYFDLIEIMRSPETIKQLSGSSLKTDI